MDIAKNFFIPKFTVRRAKTVENCSFENEMIKRSKADFFFCVFGFFFLLVEASQLEVVWAKSRDSKSTSKAANQKVAAADN